MADYTKTVEIIFGGKNQLGPALTGAQNDLDKFNKSINNVATPLAGVAEDILKLDAALAALVVGGLAYAIKSAGEFGGKFGEITTLIDDTGAPIGEFKNQILDYSSNSVKSIDEINNAIYTAISAGVDYKNSIDFVTAAEKLSVAGRSDLGITTKALIGTLNAYGEGTDQASKYSDIMFTTVKLGLTTMSELSNSLAMVTGLAATSGIPFETLSAAIATLTSSGLTTEATITGIRQAIQNIIKPSGEAEKASAALGIQFDAAALKTKGFEGVLWDAYKATDGDIGKMGQLFGSVESLNAVMILGADKTGKFASSMEDMGKSAGATQIAYDKIAGEHENVNRRLANNFKSTFIKIGEEILPEYKKIAGALGDLLIGIKIGIDEGAFDPLFEELDRVGNALTEWLGDMAAAMPDALKKVDFTKLADALKGFSDAFTDAFSFNAADPEVLAHAIQEVSDTIASLIDVSRGIGEAFGPFIDLVKTSIESFNNLDQSTKTLTGNLLGASLAYKMFGPAAAAVMVAFALDSEDSAWIVNKAFASIENGINVLKVGVLELAYAFALAFEATARLLDYIPGHDGSEDIKRTSENVKILGDLLDEANDKLYISTERLRGEFSVISTETDKARVKVLDYQEALFGVPSHIETKIGPILDKPVLNSTINELTDAFMSGDVNEINMVLSLSDPDIKATQEKLNTYIPEKKFVDVKVRADGSSIETAWGIIIEKFPDGSSRLTQAKMGVDQKNLDAVKNEIDKTVPPEKVMQIQAEINIAKIKAQSDIVQSSIEWKAKMDIADVEADTERIKSIVDSIGVSITSTGTALSSMVGSLKGIGGSREYSDILNEVKRESDRRDNALLLQKDLTTATVAEINARTQAMQKGQALITINGAGLQPHLEAFMFEILKAIQIQANAEGQKFLVGL